MSHTNAASLVRVRQAISYLANAVTSPVIARRYEFMSTSASRAAWCGVCGHVHTEVPLGRACPSVVDDHGAAFREPLSERAPMAASAMRVRELGHWAWVPAIFCLVLMLPIPSWWQRLPLLALAALCVAGGYAASRSLERGSRREHPHRSEAKLQRGIRSLPGVYAAVAVCCHVYVTALLGLHAGLPGLRAEGPAAIASASTRAVEAPIVRASVAGTRTTAGGGATGLPTRASRRAMVATFAGR